MRPLLLLVFLFSSLGPVCSCAVAPPVLIEAVKAPAYTRSPKRLLVVSAAGNELEDRENAAVGAEYAQSLRLALEKMAAECGLDLQVVRLASLTLSQPDDIAAATKRYAPDSVLVIRLAGGVLAPYGGFQEMKYAVDLFDVESDKVVWAATVLNPRDGAYAIPSARQRGTAFGEAIEKELQAASILRSCRTPEVAGTAMPSAAAAPVASPGPAATPTSPARPALPPTDRPWTSREYDEAARALGQLDSSALPRLHDSATASVFVHITDPTHLRGIDDRSVGARQRLRESFEIFEAVKFIGRVYRDSSLRDPSLAEETNRIFGFLLEAGIAVVEISDEWVAGVSTSDPAYAERLRVVEDLNLGLAELGEAALSVIGDESQRARQASATFPQLDASQRAELARVTLRYVKALSPKLSPGLRDALLANLRRVREEAKDPAIRTALQDRP